MGYCSSDTVLRVLAFLFTFFAAAFMFVNKQVSNFGGLIVSASYKQSPTFGFFVIGNAIAGAYALVSSFISCLYNVRMDNKSALVFLLDLVATNLVMAAAASATSLGYVAMFGNDNIGWPKVCQYYTKFCDKTAYSVGASYIGFVILLSLCVCSFLQRRGTPNSNSYRYN